MSRLAIALDRGLIELPESGQLLILNPSELMDLSGLPQGRLTLVQRDAVLQSAFGGITPLPVPPQKGDYGAAVVFLGKARAANMQMIAQAIGLVPKGATVVINGAKTQGIEAILKTCKAHFDVSAPLSKAHGKVFAFAANDVPADWEAAPVPPTGYVTGAGVFSAEKIDTGSQLLIDTLPALKGTLCDLGAGWGYLSQQLLLKNEAVKQVDLIEADFVALEAAKQNVSDARAQFHWSDALTWGDKLTGYDVIISNPPFHSGSETNVTLGQQFLHSAARLLKPRGQFYFVANRHLPYEKTVEGLFRRVEVLADRNGFKVMCCHQPQKAAQRR